MLRSFAKYIAILFLPCLLLGQTSGLNAVPNQSITGATLINPSIGTTGLTVSLLNATTGGTAVNKLAKMTGAPSSAVLMATSDTTGAIGIVTSGAGTSGTAQIAIAGNALCVFDNATTAGDYVQISATTAGDCHDAGAAYPSANQVVGRVLTTNVSVGTYLIQFYEYDTRGNGGGGPTLANVVTVSFSTTPTFALGTGTFQKITLTGNVSSSSVTGIAAGQLVLMQICQDGTGGRTFVWPTAFKGSVLNVSSISASKCGSQLFATVDGSNLYAVSNGDINQ